MPVYHFDCYTYGYYGSGVVQLIPDPTVYNPFGGFRNCDDPPKQWDAALGGLGINEPGTWVCGDWYQSVCCIDDECILQNEEDCATQGGEYHHGWPSCDPNPCADSGVEEREWVRDTALLPPKPNPFTRTTLFGYHLDEAGNVKIDIFDSSGRRICELLYGQMPAGSGSVTWDGRDEAGRRVCPGTYFCRLGMGGDVASERTIVLEWSS
ncbi:FlgD immunoglobulin-like domain containing protein [Candidatus Eisenbacteria bacterium]|uniref:FlgD immunoglobulin-like domain containing protein n=1 Tax=Eiseniibacteriota bacterium TaxID=2212470 RepID=A0ABV6YL01_UNCEI